MGPSALSAGIFESGMYLLVLCHIQKFSLSRIWTHLVRLEGVRSDATNPTVFAYLGTSSAPGEKPGPISWPLYLDSVGATRQQQHLLVDIPLQRLYNATHQVLRG